ncbi:hypothetical protein FB567DRAFT_578548 [Paraphoma chrysanthemicola]|uniref:Uncharacterized protein n=1 Tax=Paraphoma chrysanthemicola TaxID=798071 RepID=A0A8K0VZR9_9PLEO|nr:hypothetical protein FB567DRAFT_578548 [Paraphoma chrysanthemicola]
MLSTSMRADKHPIYHPAADPLSWLDLIFGLLSRMPDMLSTNQLIALIALLLLACLYFVVAGSWSHRLAERNRTDKRFGQFERIIRPLEHAPSKIGTIEVAQGRQNRSRLKGGPCGPRVATRVETKLVEIKEKIDNFIRDQAGKAEAASKQESKQSELDTKLEAVLEKIEQIEPLQPVAQKLTSVVCERGVETTPIDLSTPSLSVSVVASQDVAPIDQTLPKLGMSAVASLSTGPLAVQTAPMVESGVQTDDITQQLSVSLITTTVTTPLGTNPYLISNDLAQENAALNTKIDKVASDHGMTQAHLIEEVGAENDELTFKNSVIEKKWLDAKSELATSQTENTKTTQSFTKLSEQYASACEDLASEKKQVLETKGALQAAELKLVTAKTKLGGAQMEIGTLNQDLDANSATFGRMVDAGIDVELYINDTEGDFNDYLDDFEEGLAQREEDASIIAKDEQSTKAPVPEVTSTIVTGLNADALDFKPSLQPSSTPIQDQTVKSEVIEDDKKTPIPVVEVTSQSEAGLKESEHAHIDTSSTLGTKSSDKLADSTSTQNEQNIDTAVELKTPVKKLTGMGMSKYAVETPTVHPVKQDTILTPVKDVKGAATPNTTEEAKALKITAPKKQGQAVIEVKPAVKGGLENSKYASASASIALAPRPTPQPAATKSKIDDAEKQAPAVDDASRLQLEKIIAGAGEVDGATELQFCRVCKENVQVEVCEEFEYAKKKFFDEVPVPTGSKKVHIWEGHNFDFHDKCPDCNINVCAPYDSNSGKNDFTEHKKVCSRRRTPSTPSSGLRTAPFTTTSSSSRYIGRQGPKHMPEPEHPDGLQRCRKCNIWLNPMDRTTTTRSIQLTTTPLRLA